MKSINAKRGKKIVSGAIVVGMMLYLSKFLRPCFSDNNFTLFILGFLPNFGLAFAMPFIYIGHRVLLNKPVKHFTISCIVTILLIILNEIRDKYQLWRVFDWYDIYASFVGVIFASLVFYTTLKERVFQISKDH